MRPWTGLINCKESVGLSSPPCPASAGRAEKAKMHQCERRMGSIQVVCKKAAQKPTRMNARSGYSLINSHSWRWRTPWAARNRPVKVANFNVLKFWCCNDCKRMRPSAGFVEFNLKPFCTKSSVLTSNAGPPSLVFVSRAARIGIAVVCARGREDSRTSGCASRQSCAWARYPHPRLSPERQLSVVHGGHPRSPGFH
jgi:hypothetical protein